jgi:hypothetical protein
MGSSKAFISRMPCGHVVASSWDDERRPADAIPKFIKEQQRQGYTVVAEDAVPGIEQWINDDCRHGRCERPLARQPAADRRL